jgi:hypothetical protein
MGEADRLAPSELTTCDVMSLDCEGVEDEIIYNMNVKPSRLIVETHEPLGTSAEDVIEALDSQGYEIDERRATLEGPDIELVIATKRD